MKIFQVCTISNDLAAYREMKESFLQAGFDEGRCRYTLLDNSADNLHEPFSAFDAVLAEAEEPYCLFCHQDVRLDRGDGIGKLLTGLTALAEKDAAWAVAGNAGGTGRLEVASVVVDPGGEYDWRPLPQRVYSLDENFIVVRSDAGLRPTAALSGFHFYATDLCLHAVKAGRSCYVIDFRLTHLSSGDVLSRDFQERYDQFRRWWDKQFFFCLIRTPCTSFALSRSAVVRAVFRSGRVMGWIRRHAQCYAALAHLAGRLHLLLPAKRPRKAAPRRFMAEEA